LVLYILETDLAMIRMRDNYYPNFHLYDARCLERSRKE
jgi:hypothetical protein